MCYCNAICAKQDWQFHKRICSKPVAPAPAPASTSATSTSNTTSESVSSTSSTSTSAPHPPPSKKSTLSTNNDDIEYDEDEKAAIDEIKRKGYRHFTSQADVGGLKGVAGGLAPKAVILSDVTTSPTASSSNTVASISPLSSSSSSSSSSSAASEWNKSGTTYEARSLGDSCKSRLKELLGGIRTKEAVSLPGIGTLVPSSVTSWGESMADIVITRGKVKHIYDLSFKVSVQIVPEAEVPGEGDGEEEDDTKAKTSSSTNSSSTTSTTTSSKSNDTSVSPKPPKRPRVLVSFVDVSNTTEGDSNDSTFRDVKIEWGTPSPQEAHKNAIKEALGVERKDGGLVFALRKAVETVVDEFKRK